MTNKKLYRSCSDKMLGGVAGGLAEYFEVDSVLMRLIFLLLILAGAGILVYLLAWIIIPLDPKCESDKSGADEIKETTEKIANDVKKTLDHDKSRQGNEALVWLGIILVAFGAIAIFNKIVGFSFWAYMWPVLIIVIGIVIVTRSMEK